MINISDKTPSLGSGLAQSVMCHILKQVKSQRGLTKFIQCGGINGRWLKPDEPYDIRITKFVKIMAIKARYQSEDEFLNDWNATGKLLVYFARNPQLLRDEVSTI